MANYFNLKNDQILNPPANTSLGSNAGSYSNVYVEGTLVLGNVTLTEATIGPIVESGGGLTASQIYGLNTVFNFGG